MLCILPTNTLVLLVDRVNEFLHPTLKPAVFPPVLDPSCWWSFFCARCRRRPNPEAFSTCYLHHAASVQVLALRKVVLTLCYLRLACISAAASRVTVHPDVFMLFTALAHALDVLCRYVWNPDNTGSPGEVPMGCISMYDSWKQLVRFW